MVQEMHLRHSGTDTVMAKKYAVTAENTPKCSNTWAALLNLETIYFPTKSEENAKTIAMERKQNDKGGWDWSWRRCTAISMEDVKQQAIITAAQSWLSGGTGWGCGGSTPGVKSLAQNWLIITPLNERKNCWRLFTTSIKAGWNDDHIEASNCTLYRETWYHLYLQDV